MKYLTNDFINFLKENKSKINQKAINFLDKDEEEYIFMKPIENYNIPDYVYNLFLKFKKHYEK